ncbi:nuclear transport factor 2 family protein [Lacticaseibacillus hulanensis]|uniref:nuclear transport factor 2 family protein n=1 Tax=Lacticaseibacillus hulanensis TaxID=2493111 RepID=UPI000FDA7612|nr:nuclear transport factor 2 family protein [Lacticaseibacillus hulanensis]
MSDIEAISQLVLWERQARGRGLNDELANCYWEDGTVTTSWSTGNARATFVGQRPVDYATSLPLVGRYAAPIVHLNGNRAYAELPSTTKHWVNLDGEIAIVESFMRLIYCVEKRNGEWKISDMTAIDEADTIAPEIPGTDLHIDAKLARSLRSSYRYLAYTRIKAGGKIGQDGIGIDRPETVKPVYDRAENWIK